MKNKSVKQPFVTKNSKDLVGTGAEILLALIEFTPLRKTSVKLPFVTKNLKYVSFACNKNKTIVNYLH